MFKQFVVPVDGSEPSEQAVSLAIQFAKEQRARILFCHAIDELAMIRAGGAAGVDWQPGIDDLRRQGQRVLDAAKARAAQAGVTSDIVMSDQSPVDGVLDAVESCGADLIVMGTHGRKGFSRAVLGSTTEGVLRRAHIPVLVSTPPARVRA